MIAFQPCPFDARDIGGDAVVEMVGKTGADAGERATRGTPALDKGARQAVEFGFAQIGARMRKRLFERDKPRVRVWPKQVSVQGFAHRFFNETIVPDPPKEPSPWALLAGRARLGKNQVMVGLAVQGIKPNTIGKRTVESDQWANVLRIRVRD